MTPTATDRPIPGGSAGPGQSMRPSEVEASGVIDFAAMPPPQAPVGEPERRRLKEAAARRKPRPDHRATTGATGDTEAEEGDPPNE